MRLSAFLAAIASVAMAGIGISRAEIAPAPSAPIIAVSPDGGTYAQVNNDNDIDIRSVAQLPGTDPVSTIKVGGDVVSALTFSSDGTLLAAATDNRQISIWQVANGNRVSRLSEPSDTRPELKRVSHVASLAFNASGTELALVDDGFSWLERFSGASITELRYRSGTLDAAVTKTPMLSVAADGHGGWVCGNSIGELYFYDTTLKQRGVTAPETAGPIRAISVSPDTLVLAAGGDNHEVKLWFFAGSDAAVNGGSFHVLKEFTALSPVLAVVFRGDQKGLLYADASARISTPDLPSTPTLIATAAENGGASATEQPPKSNTSAEVSSAKTPVTGTGTSPNPPVVTPATPPATTAAPTTTPPEKPVSPAQSEKSSPKQMGIRDPGKSAVAPKPVTVTATLPPPVKNTTASLSFVKSLIGHSEFVNSVAFSPDGRMIASGSRDDTVRLWDVGTGEPLKILGKHGGYVSCVAFSPENNLLASGGWDNRIKLFELPDGTPKDEGSKLDKHSNFVLSLAFSADGKYLADGSNDKTARVFSFATGISTPTSVLPDAVATVGFSPDGSQIAGGCLDGNVYVWDAKSLKLLHKLVGNAKDPIFCMTFLDEKTLVAGGRGGYLRVWRVDNSRPIATVAAGGKDIFALAYNRDTHLLASGGTDNIIRLWDGDAFEKPAKDIEPIATGKKHTNTVRAIAFSPDGKMMASGSWDDTIALWDVTATRGAAGGGSTAAR